MLVTDVVWKERYVAKLWDKHRVSTDEAEEVLRSEPLFRRVAKGRVKGQDLYTALGQIRSGRYLIVFFINKGRGVALPISARDMDSSERRYYGKHSHRSR